MALRTVVPEYLEDPIYGPVPDDFYGVDPIDGDADAWIQVGPGASYIQRDLTNNLAKLPKYKMKSNDSDFDWGGLGCVCEKVSRSTMTDGGSTSGTYALKTQIPVGAYVLNTLVQELVGFTGDTSATITVGDGSDVDRYNTGTPSVFTTANQLAMGVPSGTKEHTAAATVTVTITSNADFTNVTAGSFTIKIFYLR